MKRTKNEDASLDMTPMIDVVFQLIIFFVVTLKMTDNKDSEIKLEDGRNGIVLTQDELPPSQLTIDVFTDKKTRQGVFKISNQKVTLAQIQQKVKERYLKYYDFPCMIRADWRTEHVHVRDVIAACNAGQIDAYNENHSVSTDPKISFVAISMYGSDKAYSLAAHWKPPEKKKK